MVNSLVLGNPPKNCPKCAGIMKIGFITDYISGWAFGQAIGLKANPSNLFGRESKLKIKNCIWSEHFDVSTAAFWSRMQSRKNKYMSVIEFQTTVEDGKIVIPLKLRDKVRGEINVVVEVKENEEEPFDMIAELIKKPLKVDDPTPLTREEIYDRESDCAENFINWLIKNPLKVDKSVPFLKRNEIYDRKL